MNLVFVRQAGTLLFICMILILLHGSRGEIPSKPIAATILPSVKPNDGVQTYAEDQKNNLPVFTMNYPRIQIPFEITLWVLLASFAKIGE